MILDKAFIECAFASPEEQMIKCAIIGFIAAILLMCVFCALAEVFGKDKDKPGGWSG